jgi:hypothetical protein
MQSSRFLILFAVTLVGALSIAPICGGRWHSVASLMHAPIKPVANWRNPYSNIDLGNDLGNDTGDWMVERLNETQLNRNYRGPYYFPNALRYPELPPGPYQYQLPPQPYAPPRSYPPLGYRY